MAGNDYRSAPRWVIRYPVRLIRTDGVMLEGFTRNVGRMGLFIHVPTGTEGFLEEDPLILLVQVGEVRVREQCRVVHVQEDGIGLEVFQSLNDTEGFAIFLELLLGDLRGELPANDDREW